MVTHPARLPKATGIQRCYIFFALTMLGGLPKTGQFEVFETVLELNGSRLEPCEVWKFLKDILS